MKRAYERLHVLSVRHSVKIHIGALDSGGVSLTAKQNVNELRDIARRDGAVTIHVTSRMILHGELGRVAEGVSAWIREPATVIARIAYGSRGNRIGGLGGAGLG